MRLSGNTDCHTAFCLGKNADIGHWFAMTETDFVYSLGSPSGGAVTSAHTGD